MSERVPRISRQYPDELDDVLRSEPLNTIRPQEVYLLNRPQVEAVSSTLLKLFVLSACESSAANSIPENTDINSVLSDLNTLNKLITDMSKRPVWVCEIGDNDQVKAVSMPLSNVIESHNSRFIMLIGLLALTTLTSIEGSVDDPGLDQARENIRTLLESDNTFLTTSQVAGLFDSPVMLDIAEIPLESEDGECITSLRDWIHSWLSEVDKKRDIPMRGYWNTFREHLTQGEFTQLIASQVLGDLKLLPEDSTIKVDVADNRSGHLSAEEVQNDLDFQNMRVDEICKYLQNLTSQEGFEHMFAMFLHLISGDSIFTTREGPSYMVTDIMHHIDQMLKGETDGNN